MNLFRDYISDPLYEVAIKILSSSHLFEMAYDRRDAINKIGAHASELAKKLVLVHHAVNARDLPHWKTSVNAHIREVHDLTFLRDKKRLKMDDIHNNVFESPMGEYDDYLRRYDWATNAKKETTFSPATPEDYAAIKRKYDRLLPLLLSKTTPPTHDDLLDS